MILFELTEKEARTLDVALARRVGDMMKELVHTDDHAEHEDMRAGYEELERLQQRFAAVCRAHGRSQPDPAPSRGSA